MKSSTRTTTIRRPMNMAYGESGFIEDARRGNHVNAFVQRLTTLTGEF
jgi:hypothetical protein